MSSTADRPVIATDVVIFSDEPGWHDAELHRQFLCRSLNSISISLCDCRIAITNGKTTISLPGLHGQSPRGAFVRSVSKGSLEQVVERLNILHLLEYEGVHVYNSGRAIERTVDKAMTSYLLARDQITVPDTWVFETRQAVFDLVRAECVRGAKLLLKPLFGSQGNGIRLIQSVNDLSSLNMPGDLYYLQKFIDNGLDVFRDIRVFVIDGKAEAAMARSSAYFATNRAQNAQCEKVTLTLPIAQLAEAAAASLGVDYAGIDLIKEKGGRWFVLEVNGIPAWQGLQRESSVDISTLLAESFIAKL